MFRRGVQFEITHELQHLKTNDDIVSFLNVLGTELKVNNINSLLIKIFVNIKHQLTDESLRNILKWLKENCTLNNASPINGEACKKQTKCVEFRRGCSFKKIPNDVFYHIESYLPYLDAIKLSQTNHLFHKKIHNKSFVDSFNRATQGTLNLSAKRLFCLCNMGTSYANLSYHKWNQLVIGDEIEEDRTLHCSKYNKCSFCQIISQIDEYNNYDLQWFANILSNVEHIHLSNNWPCLWNEIPLKWLLKKDKVGTNNPLQTVAATNGNDIDNDNGRAFADHYESYFVNQCESDLHKIRAIETICLSSSSGYCYPKMNENYSMLLMERGDTFECQTLSQFLKIFHQNMISFDAVFDDQTDLSGIFFDSSSDIYKDMNLSRISLESFKSKYTIDECTLPRIENGDIFAYTSTTNGCAKLLQLFQDSKLMTILNFEMSLKHLCINIFQQNKNLKIPYSSLIDIFNVIIDNYIQIEDIDIMLASNNRKPICASPSGNHVFLDKMELLFGQLYFEPVLYKILCNLKSNSNDKSSKNLNEITIGWGHRYCQATNV